MAFPDDCESFFNCEDGKKQKSATWEGFWKFLIGSDANGCPALKTTATISGDIEVTATSTERVPTRTSTGASGSVAAGARSVSIETSDDFVGTILGVTAQASRFYNFEVKQNDDTIGAIAYTITSGSIVIGKLV